MRRLGGSVGILSSVYRLRERITLVLYLFHENAANLFPRYVHHKDIHSQATSARLTAGRRSKPPSDLMPPVVVGELSAEDFPEQVSQFAEDIATFLACLNDFPGLADEELCESLFVFLGDLRVGSGGRPSRYPCYGD